MDIQITDSSMEGLISNAVQSELARRGLSPEDASKVIHDHSKEYEKERFVHSLLKNNGFLNGRDSLKFNSGKEAWEARVSYGEMVDALSTTNFTHLIPRVISQVVREAVEPELNLTRLL